MGRRKKSYHLEVAGVPQEEGFAPPSLRIGGVELTAGVAYRGDPRRSRQQSSRQQPAHQEGELGDDDEALALADYMDNVLNGSNTDASTEQGHGQHAFVRGADQEVGEVDGAMLDGAYTLSSDSDSSSSSSDSLSEEDDDDEQGNAAQQPAAHVITSREVVQVLTSADGTQREVTKRMTAAQQFPFTMRAANEDSRHKGGGAGGRHTKQRSVAKGAFGGTLLPGEKKKLKKEQKEAKRAARDARRGFDVEVVAQQLHEFMDSEGDMLVLDAHGKHAQECTMRLVRLAGLKAGIQGSGKHQMVVGSWPQHVIPGPMTKQVAAKVRAAVDAELAAQRKGSAAGAGVGPAGSAMATAMAEARAARRNSKFQASGRGQTEQTPAGLPAHHSPASKRAQRDSPAAALPGILRPQSKFQIPIRFVRGATMVDNSTADVVMIFPPRGRTPQQDQQQLTATATTIDNGADGMQAGAQSLQAEKATPAKTQSQASMGDGSGGCADVGDVRGETARQPADMQDVDDSSTLLPARQHPAGSEQVETVLLDSLTLQGVQEHDLPGAGPKQHLGQQEQLPVTSTPRPPPPPPPRLPPPPPLSSAQQEVQEQTHASVHPAKVVVVVEPHHATHDMPAPALEGITSLWEQMERRFAAPLQAHEYHQGDHQNQHEHEHQHQHQHPDYPPLQHHQNHPQRQHEQPGQQAQDVHAGQHHLPAPPAICGGDAQVQATDGHLVHDGEEVMLEQAEGTDQMVVEGSSDGDHHQLGPDTTQNGDTLVQGTGRVPAQQSDSTGTAGCGSGDEDEEDGEGEGAGLSDSEGGSEEGVEGGSDEEQHAGLGYHVGSEGHMYQLSGIGIGLDGRPMLDYHQYMLAEALSHQPDLLQGMPGGTSGTTSSGTDRSARGRNKPRRHGSHKAVRSYVMDAVLGTGSPGLGTERVMRRNQYDPAQTDVFLEAEFDMSVNLTKQQAKAASKKAAKLARRAAGAAAADGSNVGVPRAGLGVMPQMSALHLTFAGFEKHTTGIGSQLMRRWGWAEGSGLGRSQQGRAVPVMAHKRPKNLGLGALPEEQQSNAAAGAT